MKIIVGIGNKGDQYYETRHNIGFVAIDYLKNKWNFPDFQDNSKLLSSFSQSKIKTKTIILSKPLLFMNESGLAIKKLLQYYKLTPEHLIVIHDDTDILFGKYKTSFSSRSAGHKGVESIINYLKTNNFIRIRIGVRPLKERYRQKAEQFVLKKFTNEEKMKIPIPPIPQNNPELILEKINTTIEEIIQ